MARLTLPTDFFAQQQLLATVKAKHDADGASSPLTAYLALHGIDLAADTTAGNQAADFETTRQKRGRESEDFTEKRNNKFNPVMAHLRGCFGFLKSFYARNVSEAGLWGAPITTTGKISYPPKFLVRAEIFKALKAKYDSILPPTPNPLQAYLTQNEISLTDDEAALQDALAHNTASSAAAREAEDALEKRDNLWKPVMLHIRGIGGLLMKLYNTNPKMLGEYGFRVVESIRPNRLRRSTVPLGGKRTSSGIIIGGNFTNTGTADLLLYKGATTTGNAITVTPGEIIKVTKGYYLITVVNTSSLEKGIFSVIAKG